MNEPIRSVGLVAKHAPAAVAVAAMAWVLMKSRRVSFMMPTPKLDLVAFAVLINERRGNDARDAVQGAERIRAAVLGRVLDRHHQATIVAAAVDLDAGHFRECRLHAIQKLRTGMDNDTADVEFAHTGFMLTLKACTGHGPIQLPHPVHRS